MSDEYKYTGEVREALKRLLAYYEKEARRTTEHKEVEDIRKTVRCELCVSVNYKCRKCPWVLEHGKMCVDYTAILVHSDKSWKDEYNRVKEYWTADYYRVVGITLEVVQPSLVVSLRNYSIRWAQKRAEEITKWLSKKKGE